MLKMSSSASWHMYGIYEMGHPIGIIEQTIFIEN